MRPSEQTAEQSESPDGPKRFLFSISKDLKDLEVCSACSFQSHGVIVIETHPIPDDEIEDESDKSKARAEEKKVQLDLHEARINEIQILIDLNKARVNKTEVLLDLHSKHELVSYAIVALLDLARHVIKSTQLCKKRKRENPKDDESTTKWQRFAASVEEAHLIEARVPTKYWPKLRNLDKLLRNEDTDSHQDGHRFAMFLMEKKMRDTRNYEMWKDVFPLIYGGTVEEVGEPNEWDRMFMI